MNIGRTLHPGLPQVFPHMRLWIEQQNIKKNVLKILDTPLEKGIFSAFMKIMKSRFQDKTRDSGAPYFKHLLDVLNHVVMDSHNPTLLKALIALGHDSIEDTDYIYADLLAVPGPEAAFGIQLISKASSLIYGGDKEKRNEDYFGKMKSIDTFLESAHKLNTEKKCGFTTKKVEEIALSALEVKIWDRINNLSTEMIHTNGEAEHLEKAERKLAETENYFVNISKELDRKTGSNTFQHLEIAMKKVKDSIEMSKIEHQKQDDLSTKRFKPDK